MNFLPPVLKAAFIQANERFTYNNEGSDFTPSSLTDSPRQRRLKRLYPKGFVPEAQADAIQGTVLHWLLEQLAIETSGMEPEVRVHVMHMVDGMPYDISAQIDLLTTEQMIDYKRRSVWEVLIDKDTDVEGVAWETYWQLQVGAWLLRHPLAFVKIYKGEWSDDIEYHTIDVADHLDALIDEGGPDTLRPKELITQYWFKDWVKSKAMRGEHPVTPAMFKSVEPVDDTVVEAWINQRIRMHESEDWQKADCEVTSTWEKDTVYKVFKNDNKSAMRGGVKKTLAEAQAMKNAVQQKDQKNEYTVKEFPGERVACQSYCDARFHCELATNPLPDPWEVIQRSNE